MFGGENSPWARFFAEQFPHPVLATTLFGRALTNPIGLAAGFDKNARVYDRMAAHGFGFVEIGGVTPRAQRGNPRPRVFRLPDDGAVINRLGFPNDGADAVERRLRRAGRPAITRRMGKKHPFALSDIFYSSWFASDSPTL